MYSMCFKILIFMFHYDLFQIFILFRALRLFFSLVDLLYLDKQQHSKYFDADYLTFATISLHFIIYSPIYYLNHSTNFFWSNFCVLLWNFLEINFEHQRQESLFFHFKHLPLVFSLFEYFILELAFLIQQSL